MDAQNKSSNQYPKVGVGVMIVKDGKVLLGKRKGSHGEGQYAWPGGLWNTWNQLKRAYGEK